MMNKKLITTVVAAALVAVVGIGSTLAYLQDETTGKTNTFTIGDVEIDLDEPEWNPTNGDDMLPGATVKKNPIVTNVGQTEAFIGVRIDGMKEVTDQGFLVRSDKADANVTLNANFDNADKLEETSAVFAWNPAYTLVDKEGNAIATDTEDVLTVAELADLAETNGDVLFFAYESPIAAGAQTESLFDEVTLDKDVLGATNAYTIVKHFVNKDNHDELLVADPVTGLFPEGKIPAKDEEGQYIYKFTIDGYDTKYDTYEAVMKAIDDLEKDVTKEGYEFNMIVKAAAIQSTNESDVDWADVDHWYPELPSSFLGNN